MKNRSHFMNRRRDSGAIVSVFKKRTSIVAHPSLTLFSLTLFSLTLVVGASLCVSKIEAQPKPQIKLRPQPPGSPAPDGGSTAGSGSITPFEAGIDFKPISPRTKVTFNLEDADLPDLVRLISNITGRRFILPGKARSIKATVFAPTKVSVAAAYNAFLSILEINGMTVVPAGAYLKIVDSSNAQNQPLPTYTGGSPTPRQDRYMTRLHRLTNVSSEDMVTLLTRFKSADGQVTAYAPTNTLILTDTGTQIRRMLRLIESMDVPRTGEQVWIEPIHYANATELAARLAEIFPSGGGAAAPARPNAPRAGKADKPAAGGGGGTVGSRNGESRITNILAEERTNSLIILATERAYLRIMELIRRLDVPLEGEGRIHVHYVQNGAAADIASTLQSLTGGGGGPASGGARRGGAAAAAPASGGASLFEGQIGITAHEPTNALVITSSLHDYAALRRVIERLDAPRRQVFIEAVVMELSVSRSNSLGFSFHGGIPGLAGDGSVSILGFNAGQSVAFPVDGQSLTGLALGVRGPTLDGAQQSIGLSIPGFGVVLNAMASSGDTNILSTPHLIAMDNVQAEISVGENIPLQTNAGGLLGGGGGLGALAGLAGQAGGAAGGLGALAGLAGGGAGGFGAAPRQDVGTTIRVTPHINKNDEIRMEIEEEISERGTSEGDLGAVSINRRTAKTEVMVRDQQTVVIGGLMRESVVNAETKVPVLGDIPLIGALFRSTSRQKQKSNLLLFLTPYIIRDPGDLRSIFERKMRERQEFLDRYFVFGDHEYEAPIDYSRTRGLVAEIIGELDIIEEEKRLEEEAKLKPPPDHVPRSPVGAFEGSGGGDEGGVVISPDGSSETINSVSPVDSAYNTTPAAEAAPITTPR